MQTQLVRIKTKYQVTLPLSIQRAVRLRVGDFLETKVENGIIKLVPKRIMDKRKAIIDAHLAKGLADIEAGRTYGPYDTAEDLIASLHAEVKSIRKAKKSKAVNRQ